MHLHGGGFVNTIWPQNAFLLGFAAAVKERYGCRVVGTGLGLMPAPEPGEAHSAGLRAAVEAFDLLELRDRWSYDYLRRHSASPRILLGLDDTYLLPRQRQPAPGPRTLHLSYFASADRFEHALDIASGPGADQFERVLFWSCTNQDNQCFEQLAAVCPRAERILWSDLVFGRHPRESRRLHGHRPVPPPPPGRAPRRARRLSSSTGATTTSSTARSLISARRSRQWERRSLCRTTTPRPPA